MVVQNEILLRLAQTMFEECGRRKPAHAISCPCCKLTHAPKGSGEQKTDMVHFIQDLNMNIEDCDSSREWKW